MRTIYYHDFDKEPSFQKEKIRSKFLNAYRHKLKIKVRMFDCLVGLGHGYTEDGQKVYLNAYNIITPECYLGLLPDEEILADVEIMKDKELFARNIERNIEISHNN